MLEPLLKDVMVILPAAGISERFLSSSGFGRYCPSSATAKQFVQVGPFKIPLFMHTVNTFLKIPWISQIVILVRGNQVEKAKLFLETYGSPQAISKCTVVEGSSTRHRTIQKGVQMLQSSAHLPEVVIVHDAVRPLIDEDVCRSLVLAARQFGASGVCVPLVSTVLEMDPSTGLATNFLPRSSLVASETPQAFLWRHLQAAYTMASDEELETGTECLALACRYSASSCKAKLIPVDPNRYFKVTYEKDLMATESLLSERMMKKSMSSGDFVVDARRATLCRQCFRPDGDYP